MDLMYISMNSQVFKDSGVRPYKVVSVVANTSWLLFLFYLEVGSVV